MSAKWKVHKFGGTSVLNAERYRNVYGIVTKRLPPGPKAIVVSAMKGVTDDLLKVIDLAKSQINYHDLLNAIADRHRTEMRSLLAIGENQSHPLLSTIEQNFKELDDILRSVWLVRNASERIVDLISGMGEVWSAQILNAYFLKQSQRSTWLDAREVLVVQSSGGRVTVDWQRSREKFSKWLASNPQELIVVTGFVASTADDAITTLGRNGSDYSGSIFGALFDCDEVFIWTDVDGVMSADPRLVPEAIILSEMSYSEVSELAYFGAKVVHPSTMAPAIEKQIPIWIKNTFNPDFPGTKIHKEANSDRAVKGFSTIDKMALLNVEGTGMVGIPGVAERLFGALRAAGVNVVLISQASSEHSICLAIAESQAEAARRAVTQAFSHEIQSSQIENVQVTSDVSILAAVGDNMAHSPGISGRFFTALGRSGVNVRAIAQGSSERNISAVIDTKDAIRALRTVHSSFVLPHMSISIGLIGPGLIGSTFLRQLDKQLEELRTLRKVDVQVRAIANSKKMLLTEKTIPLANWQAEFEAKAEPLELARLAAHVRPSHLPHAVMIDATASSELAPLYPQWLMSGLHIISPNKKANTGTMDDYRLIREAAKKGGRHFLYSTNVGAGLPIIQTLRDLRATGDVMHAVQGIFSGTLSYIFNQFDGARPFSEIVNEAREKGFTEPDPREDLSGQDVVRKLVILAREAGFATEVNAVEVESLVPAPLRELSKEEFLRRLPEMDAAMAKRFNDARAKKQVLRYVGSIDGGGRARVGLETLPENHAFAHVTGTDNIVLFKTDRYLHQPLVVQGPGAGPEVTAAGVFADLLRLSQYLGALP